MMNAQAEHVLDVGLVGRDALRSMRSDGSAGRRLCGERCYACGGGRGGGCGNADGSRGRDRSRGAGSAGNCGTPPLVGQARGQGQGARARVGDLAWAGADGGGGWGAQGLG